MKSAVKEVNRRVTKELTLERVARKVNKYLFSTRFLSVYLPNISEIYAVHSIFPKHPSMSQSLKLGLLLQHLTGLHFIFPPYDHLIPPLTRPTKAYFSNLVFHVP